MGCISVSAKRLGGISVSAKRLGGISVSAKRLGGINLTVSLFCEVGTNKYLLVTPTETQWINIDVSVDYNISSNTNWNIE